MSDVVVYDKAKWHHDADNYPKDLPPEQAFVHTGMFVGWALERGFISPELLEDFPELPDAFLSQSKTGPQVFQMMGGALTDEDLTKEGNAFAEAYFDLQTGVYIEDYTELLCDGLPSEYHVADTRSNYECLRDRIDERFRQWKRNQLPRSSDVE